MRTLTLSRGRGAFGLALALALLLSITGIFNHDLWPSDESRVSAIGREMLLSGDLVVPTLGGEPFLEKPPLYWWTMTGLFRLFGVTDGVARLPSVLFGILTLLLVFDMAKRAAGPLAGVAAVGVLATTANFHHFHSCVVDTALACFVTLGFWSYGRLAFRGGPADSPPARFYLLFYVAAGLAFLSKGPVGPVLLCGPVAIHIVATRRWELLGLRRHLPGLAAFVALCALWPVLLYLRGGRELLDTAYIEIVANRFHSGGDGAVMGGHKHPPWQYLSYAPGALLPWLVALPAAYRRVFRPDTERGWNVAAVRFFALVLPLGLLLLSIPGTKRSIYQLPLMAPVAVVVAAWLSSLGRRPEDRLDRYTVLVLEWAAPVLLIAAALGSGLLLAGLPFLKGLRVEQLRAGVSPLLSASGLVLSLGLAAAWFLFRRRLARPGLRLVISFCAILLLAQVVGYRVQNASKSPRPLVNKLVQWEAFQPELVGFRLDEATRGFLPWYSGREIQVLHDEDELRAYLDAHPGGRLLVTERRADRIPEDLRSSLRQTRSFELSRRRNYLLLEHHEGD